MRLKISKRQRFILTAFILSVGLLIIQFFDLSWRYQAIFILSLATYILAAWSLSEGLEGVEWLTVLSLPTLFTLGVGQFFFLVPANWFTRISIIALFGLGIYSLMLIENIFSVAAIRTIQLLRSAQAVGFLMTLVTAFFLFDTIFSYRLNPWVNSLLVFLVSLPLALPGLWCINLEDKITKRLALHAQIISFVQAEIALIISFWPVTVVVGSLALTSVLYITLGLAQHQLSGRLFKKTVNEYIIVAAVIFVVIFLTTHWGG